MSDSTFQTPILFLIYRRPDTTTRVFESIRSIRPRSLYVAADGPKKGDPTEVLNCAEARRIATNVSWDCDLHTLLRKDNLGCGLAVSQAITWFFENVDEGIILEDDCVPGTSFYRFAGELLDRYRSNEQVMHIGGNSFQFGRRRGAASYYFSTFPNVWGWASWRRAWRHYDFSLRPEWELRDTWDTQWKLSVSRAGGLSIVPNANLVQNIGFGGGGTHTLEPDRLARVPLEGMDFPLHHPEKVVADKRADTFAYYAHYRNVRFLHWIWMYQLWDFIYGSLKHIKQGFLGKPRTRG